MTMQTNQQLEKSSVNFSPNLLQVEKDYILDNRSKKIAEYEHIEVEKYCREIVLKAFMDTGQAKVDNSLLKLITTSLINETLPYKNKISPLGLRQAIEKGIRREFGDYYGINSVSFNHFLKSYINSEDRANAIIKQREHENKLIQERKEVENMDAAKNFTLYCFDKYKTSGVLYDPANVAYDWLKEKGLIKNFTKELKESIMMEAETRVRDFRLNGQNKGVPASREILDRIAARKEKKPTFEEEVLILCKQMHLRIIFDELTLEQIEQAK